MVARLTPDQKVACSIHVGFKTPNHVRIPFLLFFLPIFVEVLLFGPFSCGFLKRGFGKDLHIS